jgi:hypothetical protein
MGKYSGCTKSKSKKAPMQGKTGNHGKAIGDRGKKSGKGNRRTRVAADRYK